jgi:hypothetical protein
MVRAAASRGEWIAGASCRCCRPWPTGARAEELALLRPHMKTRLSCRARSKEFGAAPAPVAALVPPVAVVAASSGDSAGLLERCWGRPAEGGVGSRRRTAEGRRLGGARSRRRGAGHGPEGGGGSTSGTEFALMRSAPEIEALGPRTRRAAVNETGRAIQSAWRRWHDRLRARGARRRRGTRDDVSRSPTLPATSPSPREAAGNQAAAIMHWTVFSRR